MAHKFGSQVLIGAAVSAVAIAPAYAQGPVVVPRLSMDPWTGVYVGAGLSLDFLRGSLSGYGSEDYCAKSCESISLQDGHDFFRRGGNVELEAGFDVMHPRGWVVGASASLAWNFHALGSSGHVTDTYTAKDSSTHYPELDYFGEFRGSASVVARVGHTIAPDSLVYLLGGITVGRYHVGGHYDGDVGSGGFSWSRNGEIGGNTIGVGYEKFIGPKTTFKLEYRYTNYKPVVVDYCCGGSGSTRFNFDTQSVLAKLTYRFLN